MRALLLALALVAPAAHAHEKPAAERWRARIEHARTVPDRAPAPWWNDATSRRVEAGLAVCGLALLLTRRRGAALAVLGPVSLAAFFNFGTFHFGHVTHLWDSFHYFVGARYFPELGYDGLYDCVAVADAQTPAGRRKVERRHLTDLRTNAIVDTRDLLAHPERCTDRFTAARWAAFRRDVAWFRSRMPARTWEKLQEDHGFNATPAWLVLATPLTAIGPASAPLIHALNAIDPALLLAALGLLAWAFGWRTACLAALVLGTNQAARLFWTGGSILRWDWLLWMVAGVALTKKERPFWGGICLGLSALLRVFPVLLLAGPLVRWAVRRDRPAGRVLAGAALAAALVVPVSVAVAGADAWPACAANLVKHTSVPSMNRMGLRAVVAWSPAEGARALHDGRAAVPWSAWEAARAQAQAERRPVYLLLAALFAAAVLAAAVRLETWEATALASALIPILTEPACYYFMFLVVLAPLAVRRPAVGPILLSVTAATAVVAWIPPAALHWLGLPGQPWSMDAVNVGWSVVVLLGLAALVAGVLRERRPRVAPAPADGVGVCSPGAG
jgi:hypothetical protein